MKEPIIFKTEASLWEMLARGEKTWDARRHDMADDRIYRLSWGTGTLTDQNSSVTGHLSYGPDTSPPWKHKWVPDEPTVSFQNKDTGEVLTFRYLGMEFTPWSPGWCFLLLGELVEGGKGKVALAP